jgi:ubiquinone/menaquinone biosynthesis C-methylase UbiE
MPAAQQIAKVVNEGGGRELKVLDIAAGHGMFGITVARENPRATVVALDWPNVLTVAKENAQTAGVADRYTTIEGSAFDADFGAGYDAVLLTNFLHHFDPPTCETLLRKVHASLAEGGRAVTLEFVPNDDRVSPPVPAAFSMMMLGSTPAGDAYTFAEFERMFRNAGFSHSELRPLVASPEQLIIARK